MSILDNWQTCTKMLTFPANLQRKAHEVGEDKEDKQGKTG